MHKPPHSSHASAPGQEQLAQCQIKCGLVHVGITRAATGTNDMHKGGDTRLSKYSLYKCHKMVSMICVMNQDPKTSLFRSLQIIWNRVQPKRKY